MVDANGALLLPSNGDTLSGSGEDDVKVHTVDTDRGVVLQTEINVLVDTEAKVSGGGEVSVLELVLLDLEATLEDLGGLVTTDGSVDSDLLVSTDSKGTNGVTGWDGSGYG